VRNELIGGLRLLLPVCANRTTPVASPELVSSPANESEDMWTGCVIEGCSVAIFAAVFRLETFRRPRDIPNKPSWFGMAVQSGR